MRDFGGAFNATRIIELQEEIARLRTMVRVLACCSKPAPHPREDLDYKCGSCGVKTDQFGDGEHAEGCLLR